MHYDNCGDCLIRPVVVALKDGQDISDENLKRALTDAGYTVKTIERTDTPIADVRERLTGTPMSNPRFARNAGLAVGAGAALAGRAMVRPAGALSH